MGKDRTPNRKKCLRCTQWAEYGSHLCPDCEQAALQELGFHGGISKEALWATHGGGWAETIAGTWEPSTTAVMDKDVQSTPTEYKDPLDQERADSLEGGE